jgi:hypothetical protein
MVVFSAIYFHLPNTAPLATQYSNTEGYDQPTDALSIVRRTINSALLPACQMFNDAVGAVDLVDTGWLVG